MNKVFRDVNLNEQFNKEGYVFIKDLLPPEGVQALRKSYQEHYFESPASFSSTNYAEDPAYRGRIFKDLDQVITPHTKSILNDYIGLSGAFFNKKARQPSRVGMHLDWQLVDEPEHVGLNLWTPLVQTNRWNGCLQLIPGTHSGNPMFRGPNYIVPQNLMKRTKGLYKKAKRFYVKPGDAVIYNNRLIHFSGKNYLWYDRPAISFLMVPGTSLPVHYYFEPGEGSNPQKVRKYRVGPEFYAEQCRFSQKDGIYQLSEGLPLEYEDVTEENALRLKKGIEFLERNYG